MRSWEPATAREWAADAFQPVSDVLDTGRCEPLKAAVHGVLLATVSLCAAYNTAAWIKRRQSHLAINAVIYTAAAWWERCHIVHHLRACPNLSQSIDRMAADAVSPREPARGLRDNLIDAA